MTYFGFLGLFLMIPIVILLVVVNRKLRASPRFQHNLIAPVWVIVAIHCLLALVWTTPWDNYLVATEVWWYAPDQVTGITIGYVPIEEYTFFILQPIMTGLLVILLFNTRTEKLQISGNGKKIRQFSVTIVSLIWLIALILLIRGYTPTTYLSLELIWALIPMLIQLAFGADLLWKRWKFVLTAILIPSLFLSIADTIAINAGVWTISPDQSLHWLIGGILPIEELIFFILTNTLVVFGVTLMLVPESRTRIEAILQSLKTGTPRQTSS